MRAILDCDPGNAVPAADIDDGLALGLALASPEVELQAVTIVAGNTRRDTGAAIAAALLSAAAASVPVYRGAAAPLVENPQPWRLRLDSRRHDVRVSELWKQVPPPPSLPTTVGADAVGHIVGQVAAAPGQVTLVAVGPLTNIAQALSQRPEIAHEVAQIVVMGGAFAVPNLLQELNFGYDPEAARTVLTSGAPVTVVPYDVTSRTTFRPEHVERLASAGTPLARYLAETCRPWVQWIREERGLPGCHLHDPLALAAILAPGLVQSERRHVDVELCGTLTRARPVAWDPRAVASAAGLNLPDVEPIEIVTDVDNDAFVDFLLQRLCSYEQ